ncbi:type I restriction-modification system subunit M/S [Poseidonibacter lekithochrous]|uniref:type I restriction-modification system subunit M/S n=1 Tax=Poseidonibacter lekithochrous TaxID=1904463 RepID=UPI0008FCBAF4|nr:type I restriction-modification system subunit M/S [Poseidonibacter lekithochrous]QKJ24523.1 putative type I restriction/modification system methylation subunit [Poseidonibacter lekithochrous]
MNYIELLDSLKIIEKTNSEFECLTTIFTLKLFDDVFLEKVISEYIRPNINPFSSNPTFNFLNWINNEEVKKYFFDKYKIDVVKIIEEFFSYISFDFLSFLKILDITKSIETIPSIYNSFYPFISDNNSIVTDQIIDLSVKLSGKSSNEIYVPFNHGLGVGNYSNKNVYCEYEDKKINIVKLFMELHEEKNIQLNITNSLYLPGFWDKKKLKQFDTVIAFPPFSVISDIPLNLYFDRFKIHSGKRLDVAHFEHILSQTKNEAIVLMPVGFSFRSGIEEKFRKFLIDENYLKASIQLPSSMNTGNSAEMILFIIDKNKENSNVLFFDLRNEKFITKDGRQTILKDINEILELYTNGKDTEDISTISNDEIKRNNYNLSIDRYVLSQEAKEIKDKISSYDLLKINEIADVKKCQTVKEEENYEKVYEISPSDFSLSGYTTKALKEKNINTSNKQFKSYKLEPFDILLSAKGILGKIAIVGENIDNILASQAIQRIRLKNNMNLKEDAIVLYMYLKSNDGQELLHKLLKQGSAMPQISTNDLKEFIVPVLDKKRKCKIVENFNLEIEKYNQIKKIEEEITLINNSYLD